MNPQRKKREVMFANAPPELDSPPEEVLVVLVGMDAMVGGGFLSRAERNSAFDKRGQSRVLPHFCFPPF
jgi:hypothetical protein